MLQWSTCEQMSGWSVAYVAYVAEVWHGLPAH
jgi:hypothetical protein